MLSRKKLSLLLLLFSFAFCWAQKKKEITLDWIQSGESRKITAIPSTVWLKDGSYVWYDRRKQSGERILEKVDPVTQKRGPLVDQKKALKSLQTFLGEATPTDLSLPEAFSSDGKVMLYLFEDDVFILRSPGARFSRITKTTEKEAAVTLSPDGKKVGYVRSNNLFVYDTAEKKEIQLTFDGSDTCLNGTLSWVYWEEVFGREDIGYWWADDSRKIAFLKTDESQVPISYFIDYREVKPKLITQRYPKPGDPNPRVQIGVADLDRKKTALLNLQMIDYEYILRVSWLPDNRRICVRTLNRAQTDSDMYIVDCTTGKPVHILREHDDAWVTITEDLYFLKNSPHFIMVSERDGYAHLYRFSLDGKLINRITKGEWALKSYGRRVFWVIQAVAAIDEEGDWIYFTANEKSNLERHLYRIRLDGSGMERITQGNGDHRISVSPDGRFFFDRFSNAATMPNLTLYQTNGTLVVTLAEPRTDLLKPLEMQYPELFTVPAQDGFPLPAAMLKPKNFNPAKKYPVLINVYGGPAAPMVSNSWSRSIFSDQVLLNNGFIVFRVDNRLATGISKILTSLCLGEMYSDSELNDLLDAVRWLKSQSYVDGDRIGIWGWSGGGIFTILAMTRSKEFAAGIAGAPVTDWRYYDSKWAEYGMRRPEDNPEGYEKTSLVKRAKDLHGRLMIIQGTYDDNVHPQNTWNFVDALIDAGQLFDMMYYPMRKHGFSDRAAQLHRDRVMLEFWNRNLK